MTRRKLALASALVMAAHLTSAAATPRRDAKPADEPSAPVFERDAEGARKKAVEKAKELRIRGKGPFLKAAGMRSVLQGDLDGAKESFRGMLAADPKSDEGYLQLASAAEMSDDPAEAARLYTEALARRPDLAVFYLGRRARVLFQAGRWDLALKDADEGLKQGPKDGDLLRLRAKSLINLGRYAEAAASYDEASQNGRREKTGEDAWVCSSLKSRGVPADACGG